MNRSDLIEYKLKPAVNERRLHLQRLNLNRLEKLQVIPSVTEWISLRELRNFATHEYPDAPEQNAANLNQIHRALPVLQRSLEQASSYAQKHYLG